MFGKWLYSISCYETQDQYKRNIETLMTIRSVVYMVKREQFFAFGIKNCLILCEMIWGNFQYCRIVYCLKCVNITLIMSV